MNKRRNRRWVGKYRYVLALALFAIFVIYFEVKYANSERNLLAHARISTAVIIGHATDSRGTTGHFEYQYVVNGKEFTCQAFDNCVKEIKGGPDLFIGKIFPIIYDFTDPEFSHLMMSPDEFTKYHMDFPDSLRWALKYYCKGH